MIILRTPKGWTGPKVVDGKPVEGTWRAHQVPLAELATKPEHLRQLEEWMKSYRAEELFDHTGKLIPELAELAPKGDRRMGANPHANGGLLLKDLVMPDFRDYAMQVVEAGNRECGSDARTRKISARRHALEQRREKLPRVRPGRDRFQPARCDLRSDR